MRYCRRSGVTLIELVVVVVILGLMATLATPSLGTRPVSTSSEASVVAAARREAELRAQTLRLTIDGNGSWSLVSTTDMSQLAGGTIDPPLQAVRLRITPLGICISELGSTATWDAVACAARPLREPVRAGAQ